MNICVYGASSTELYKVYTDSVESLGKEMAHRNHGLVFGGGAHGLMGAVVRGVNKANGFSLGIAPKFFDKGDVLYKQCSEFVFTDTMRQRKQLMEERSDAFIMVPGGIGTFEEFFEVLTLKQLGQLNKPIGVFNVNGYYDDFIAMMQNAVAQKFMTPQGQELYGIFDDPSELLDYIDQQHLSPPDFSGLKKYNI